MNIFIKIQLIVLVFINPVLLAAVAEENNAPTLIQQRNEITRLKNELEKMQQKNERDREFKKNGPGQKNKYIYSSRINTRAYKYQEYIQNWVEEIEQVGSANYPIAAVKIKQAEVKVDVAIKSDGSLHSIRVLKYSGYKAIDDSIISIINKTAPFAPFPDSIKNETDILHIVRSWHFINNRIDGENNNK